MKRPNELMCNDCEYLHQSAIKTGNLIKMICKKFDVPLQQKDYSKEAYRCYMCRNEVKSGT